MCSTPPQMNTLSMPALIWPTASWMACMEEPHRRLTVLPATLCGNPAKSSALRAMLKPCSLVCCTQPQITSSTVSGSTAGLRSSSALISAADSVSARVLRNMPPLERPMAVRTASTMTTSCIPCLRILQAGTHHQQHVPAGTASSAAPESVKKTLALAGQLAHVGGWLVQLAEMAVALGLFTYRGQAQLTGIAQRTTAKRREAQPQHQA